MPARESVKPEINVTPLVDVVLVLLIIFMVVAPRMEQEVKLDLPKVAHADPKVEGALSPITVSVTTGGKLYLEKDALALDDLRDRLKELRQTEPGRRVLLRGDASAPYDEIRRIVQLCQDAGFPGISLQVGDAPKKES